MSVRLSFLSACSEVFTMTTNVTDPTLDGQWLDFYALLDVPVSADEDTIRRRIGKMYADASSNTEHRNLQLRMYFQSLVERVLPQARRVLLDPQWRAKYDRQHILQSIGDPSAQNYVAFIATMRGGEISNQPDSDLSQLPARVQDEIIAARQVVECARAGLELDLIPSQAVKTRTASAPELSKKSAHSSSPIIPSKAALKAESSALKTELSIPTKSAVAAKTKATSRPQTESSEVYGEIYRETVTVPQPKSRPSSKNQSLVEVQEGEAVRAKTLTAQEARDIRRRRESNIDDEPFVAPPSFYEKISGEPKLPSRPGRVGGASSRVVVGEQPTKRGQRVLSPMSLNLMVAITGVLFTISIQKFASTPAIATSADRMPVFLAVSPEMAPALSRAESAWEKTGDGQNFDVVLQEAESGAGARRALSGGESAPDAWIPASVSSVDAYNAVASSSKSQTTVELLAKTPVVLIARADHAGQLHRLFPDHQIPSWSALRSAVVADARGHFGLSDPQKTSVGSLVRFSMAREWGDSNGTTPAAAVKNNAFWKWMGDFEKNSPSTYPSTNALTNDLLQDGASRIWWGLAYESDALRAMSQGQNLELYYLPRTISADHPFCEVERVGAPVEVAMARQKFKDFLRSNDGQKMLLSAGMRPANLSLTTRVKGNPFLNPTFQERGLRQSLGNDERDASSTIPALQSAWAKRFK